MTLPDNARRAVWAYGPTLGHLLTALKTLADADRYLNNERDDDDPYNPVSLINAAILALQTELNHHTNETPPADN